MDEEEQYYQQELADREDRTKAGIASGRYIDVPVERPPELNPDES